MHRERALVLDGRGQAALTTLRSLGRRGVPVTAGASSRTAPAMWSRYADDTYRHPDLERGGMAVVDHLQSHLERTEYACVFALSDELSILLARHQDRLESTGTTIAVEEWERFRLALDKAMLFERLSDLDVPCPETYAPESSAEVRDIADEVPYPVVVKPRSKTLWTDDWSRYVQHRVRPEDYASSPSELVETYRSVRSRPGLSDYPPIVQEYVPGETTTTVVLADDGDVRAHFQERRVRTYPSSGGNSALLTPVDDDRMLAYAREIIDALEWTGPAMVEFMETPDGEFYCIEVNGRYWGSLPFAVNCGVDIPWLHYRQLLGETVSGPDDYDTDRVQRRLLFEDIRWFREQVQKGDLGAVIPFATAFYAADHTFFTPEDPAATGATLLQAAVQGGRAATDRVARLLSI